MNDSYSATRIQVMHAKLIKREEYDRLLKMSGMEIIGYLQSTEYRQDIDALALKDLRDLENIDKIIAHNMNRTLYKLQDISSERFLLALSNFLKENDAWNLRIIAKAISGRSNPKEMLDRYAKKGTFDPYQYASATSIEELSRKAGRSRLSLRRNPATLAAFNDALLHDYKTSFATDRYLIDEQNIVQLLLCKKESIHPEIIMKRMLRGGTVPRSVLRTAASATSLADAMKVLRTTKYSAAITDDLVKLEFELHRAVLRRIRHAAGRYPLGPEVVVNYLIEKDIETENIRLLIKGKQLGLEESFIREQLSV